MNLLKFETCNTLTFTEGAETPNSLIHDAENNRLTANIEENGNERAMKKSKLNENCLKSDKTTVDGVQQNGEGTYHCQFCEKSFPRLGYLKKHEQVSDLCILNNNGAVVERIFN